MPGPGEMNILWDRSAREFEFPRLLRDLSEFGVFLRNAIELRESIFAPQLVQRAQERPAKAFEESVSGPVAQAPDPIRAISPAREERRGEVIPGGPQFLANCQKREGGASSSRLTISALQIVRNGRPANSDAVPPPMETWSTSISSIRSSRSIAGTCRISSPIPRISLSRVWRSAL